MRSGLKEAIVLRSGIVDFAIRGAAGLGAGVVCMGLYVYLSIYIYFFLADGCNIYAILLASYLDMPTLAAFEHRTHRSLANGERTALGKNSYIDSVLSYITKLALCSEELLVGGSNSCSPDERRGGEYLF